MANFNRDEYVMIAQFPTDGKWTIAKGIVGRRIETCGIYGSEVEARKAADRLGVKVLNEDDVVANWSAYKDFAVGDTVEAIRDNVHKKGVKGTVTAVRPDALTVKWSDDGFHATYGKEGNFKNLTPPKKPQGVDAVRTEIDRYGARDKRSRLSYLTAHRRGITSKYGRDAYDQAFREVSAMNGEVVENDMAMYEANVNPIKIDGERIHVQKAVSDLAKTCTEAAARMKRVSKDKFEQDDNELLSNLDKASRKYSGIAREFLNSRNSVVSNALAWKRGVAVNGEVHDRLVEFKKLIDSNINQGAVRDGYVRIVQAVQKAGLESSPILGVAHGILSDYSLNDFYSKHKKEADAKLDSLIVKFAANSVCNAKFKVGDRVMTFSARGKWCGPTRIERIITSGGQTFYECKGDYGMYQAHEGDVKLANSSVPNAKFKVGDRVAVVGEYARQRGKTGAVSKVDASGFYTVKLNDGTEARTLRDDDLTLANSSGAVANAFSQQTKITKDYSVAMSKDKGRWVVLAGHWNPLRYFDTKNEAIFEAKSLQRSLDIASNSSNAIVNAALAWKKAANFQPLPSFKVGQKVKFWDRKQAAY